MSGMRSLRFSLLVATALIPALLAMAAPDAPEGKSKTPAAQEQKTARTVRVADPDQYVGSETCRTCHEEMFKSHEAGPHWKTDLMKDKGPEWKGCESCHGPGKEHVEGGGDTSKIFRFSQVTGMEASQQCLDCHTFSDEHSNFLRSQHNLNNVGCTSCHSAHKPKVQAALMKDAQPQLCYSCHLDAKADFNKPFRHRVNEKLVACSDCHNPHGGFLTKQVRSTAAQDAVCFQCHTEKRGPFVFEHAPVKTEGCVSCHTPHGSSNPRLLKRSQVNLLCLECHTFTVDSAAPAIPSFHNQAQKYQACTTCHVTIHGSNFSDVFFK